MTIDHTRHMNTRLLIGRIIAVIVTAVFIASAVTKLVHVAKVVEGLTGAGIPEAAIVPIGILELSCLALYLFPKTSICGTFLLTGYIGGAIVTHIIGRQTIVPPLMVGVLMFVSAYLRHTELHDVVPFRNSTKIPGQAYRTPVLSRF